MWSYLLLAGVFTGSLPDAITSLLAFTALFGAAAHYGAILARQQKAEVDRATALGLVITLASVSVIGLVELLNSLEAAPAIAALSICVAAVVGGSLLGFFVDRLPD